MKKLFQSLMLLGFAILLSSCSSVKILDSWQGDNLNTIEGKKILVIARTENKQARIAFEEAMANDLRSIGLKATESFLIFPNYNPDKKLLEEEKQNINDLLEKENYQGILITVLKDYSEAVVTEESGGYYAGGATYGRYGYGGFGGYGGYYGGFYNYYHHPMSYSTYGNYVPSSSTTRVSKTYIVETLIYNLDQPEDKQLIGLVTSKVVDPSSVTKLSKSYSSAVFKSLKK